MDLSVNCYCKKSPKYEIYPENMKSRSEFMKNTEVLSGSNYHRICLKIALLEHFSEKQGQVAFGKPPRAMISTSELLIAVGKI